MRFRAPSWLWVFALSACVHHSHDASAANEAADAGVVEDAAVVEQPVEHASVVDPSCIPPDDCLPPNNFAEFKSCCSDTLRCGWDVGQLAEVFAMDPEDYGRFGLRVETPCAPRSALFFELAPQAEQRVPGAGAGDILITPECTTRAFANALLPGCCLPDDTCGLSTTVGKDVFVTLLRNDFVRAPFTFNECVTWKQLNDQLAATALAPWAFVPPSKGKCNYAALDARLPPL